MVEIPCIDMGKRARNPAMEKAAAPGMRRMCP
jgi:hypothetical protein